ncbi:hypothetical protein [Xanthobacter versatilis]|uniref:hypothetical protein n=1 Tax=Xanthobacter autotrophicus (strain ATCC BAA-1158 / Py2) TaxID=78245 RepID=UPI003728464A
MTGRGLHALELLIAHGPLVQRGEGWVRTDGSGGLVPARTVAALERRELITIGVTGYGRTASINPKGILYRSRKRERMYRQRKGKPWPQDTSPLPG